MYIQRVHEENVNISPLMFSSGVNKCGIFLPAISPSLGLMSLHQRGLVSFCHKGLVSLHQRGLVSFCHKGLVSFCHKGLVSFCHKGLVSNLVIGVVLVKCWGHKLASIFVLGFALLRVIFLCFVTQLNFWLSENWKVVQLENWVQGSSYSLRFSGWKKEWKGNPVVAKW